MIEILIFKLILLSNAINRALNPSVLKIEHSFLESMEIHQFDAKFMWDLKVNLSHSYSLSHLFSKRHSPTKRVTKSSFEKLRKSMRVSWSDDVIMLSGEQRVE